MYEHRLMTTSSNFSLTLYLSLSLSLSHTHTHARTEHPPGEVAQAAAVTVGVAQPSQPSPPQPLYHYEDINLGAGLAGIVPHLQISGQVCNNGDSKQCLEERDQWY